MAQAILIAEKGTREVTRDLLEAVPTPARSGRWHPVPFSTVLKTAEESLTRAGYEVENMRLALGSRNQRFFATMTLQCPLAAGAMLAVGLRSSHDQSLAMGWAIGSRVLVCSNLAFSSQKVIARKHTTFGATRFAEAICRCVKELADYREHEAFRIRQMQAWELTDEQAESVLLRAYEQGILGPRALPVALDEWRKPTFADFEGHTAWSLYNAITFALRHRVESNPQAFAHATVRLGPLLLPGAAPARAN